MNDENLIFKVEKNNRMIKFTNNCENHSLLISLKPLKPKRKYIDITIVPSEQYYIIDQNQTGLDLCGFSFTLTKNKGE